MSVYIKVYNFFGILVSLLALYFTFTNIFTHSKPLHILLCQSFFLLEIVNIRRKVSNSKLLPTLLQLSSRIFILVIALFLRYSTSFTIMCVSWYLSDFIRYCYYFSRNRFFKWMRYNFFIALYPVGVGMEMKLVGELLRHEIGWFVAVTIFMAYIPGFAFLYYHMIKQRRFANRTRVKKRNMIKERAK